MPSTITFRDIDGLADDLRKLAGPALDRALQNAAVKIGERIRYRLTRYPGPSHKPVIWRSDQEQLWYHAMRAVRNLPLKYKRKTDPMSQDLMNSWHVRREGSSKAIVGTRVMYAPQVQSKEKQHPQHKATGWPTAEDAIEDVDSKGLPLKYVKAEIASMLA